MSGPQQHHDHDQTEPPSELTLRVKALESLLIDKGLVDPAAIDALIDTYETKVGPRNGAQVVARAWRDPAFKQWLLEDATAAIASMGYTGRQGEQMTKPSVAINELPVLPRDQDGPVFNEPWEAQAFALAVRLSEAGCFTWPEWATALSQEIKAVQARGDPDLGQTYYQHWLNALERLCVEKGLVGREDMRQRTEAWRRAFLHAPHGQPVELSAAFQ